jgi:hypothetical protein
MMYVDVLDFDTNKTTRYCWHVGEAPNFGGPLGLVSGQRTVMELFADFDELDYIREGFEGIPIRKFARHVIWTGEVAEFIARNL